MKVVVSRVAATMGSDEAEQMGTYIQTAIDQVPEHEGACELNWLEAVWQRVERELPIVHRLPD